MDQPYQVSVTLVMLLWLSMIMTNANELYTRIGTWIDLDFGADLVRIVYTRVTELI